MRTSSIRSPSGPRGANSVVPRRPLLPGSRGATRNALPQACDPTRGTACSRAVFPGRLLRGSPIVNSALSLRDCEQRPVGCGTSLTDRCRARRRVHRGCRCRRVRALSRVARHVADGAVTAPVPSPEMPAVAASDGRLRSSRSRPISGNGRRSLAREPRQRVRRAHGSTTLVCFGRAPELCPMNAHSLSPVGPQPRSRYRTCAVRRSRAPGR